jgi:spermidine synthase
LLLLAFFLSGLAALIFELAWTRLVLLTLGTTATAVGVVLGAFMGGMAIGSALSARRVVVERDPVLAFAAIEAFIGAYALASPTLIAAIGAVAGQELRFVLALVSLLPATIAMGASLPILVRAFAHERLAIGLGQLYAANTAGAVVGPLLAVFWFFPSVGLTKTLWVGAGLDFLVAIALPFALRRTRLAAAAVPSARGVEAENESVASSSVPWPILATVAVSGASAMVYEVAWGRTLSMVYGSSIYGVSIMLSTFLLGITIGAVAATRFLKTRTEDGSDPLLRLAKLLIASATLAFASLIVARSLPFVFLNFYTSLEGAEGTLFVSQFVIATLLMLPCTAALGATLPIATAALPEGSAGGRIARLYSWNLIGSAAGAVTASVLLLANFGIEFSIRGAAILALGLAIVLVARARSFSVATGATAGSAILIILALDPSGERVMKSFGVYSGARTYAKYDATQMRELVAAHELLFYRDGPTATVSVAQIERFRLLKINGKTDASNGPGDVATQLLLGHVPFLVTDAKRVAVIGWGSGMTVGAVLRHPVERVDAFEIEPAVIEASRFFEPSNGRPLEDERVELILGDARNELRRGDKDYDLIISEPSNPWITGVSNLFTLDFFEIANARLGPDGILCQWFHLYGMSEEATRSLIATFRQVFPHVVAFKDRDLILIGAKKPLRFSTDRLEAFYRTPSIQESLKLAEMPYPSDVLASMTLDDDGTEAFSENAPLNTDDNMYLELRAPRSLYTDEVDAILDAMRRYPPDVVAHLDDVESEADTRVELAASYFTAEKLHAALLQTELAVSLAPSFEAQKLRGQILERLGRGEEAKRALQEALDAGGDVAGRKFVEAMLRSLGSTSGS